MFESPVISTLTSARRPAALRASRTKSSRLPEFSSGAAAASKTTALCALFIFIHYGSQGPSATSLTNAISRYLRGDIRHTCKKRRAPIGALLTSTQMFIPDAELLHVPLHAHLPDAHRASPSAAPMADSCAHHRRE